MLRASHGWPSLVSSLFLVVLAVTGAILSVYPLLDRWQNSVATPESLSVAELAQRVQGSLSGVEQIERSANGSILAYYTDQDQPAAAYVSPITGEILAPYQPSGWESWFKDFHRALFMGEPGHYLIAVMAVLMFLLTMTGVIMLSRRMGGWRALLRPAKGTLHQRLHSDLARLIVLGLMISSLTGLVMTAVDFGWISGTDGAEADFPMQVSSLSSQPVGSLDALQQIRVNDLRQLVFPFPDDPMDVYSVRTSAGNGFVDQGSGQWASWAEYGLLARSYEWVYRLHTGQGLWWFGVLLGLASLGVPVLAVSGGIIWWQRLRSRPRIKHNALATQANTIILVGSQGNATWGFAHTLHNALVEQGLVVHTAAMNDLAKHYPKAERLLILTSTYGDGSAPDSATRFMQRLVDFKASRQLEYAVLGFGDRQFPAFCQFAEQVDQSLQALGMTSLMPLERIHQQSSQNFRQWGMELALILDKTLLLEHQPARPKTERWQLISRQDFDRERPTVILRFQAKGQQTSRYLPGDLIGVVAPGTNIPRFYSLASATQDGFLEICVRLHEQGHCSSFLHNMQPGDELDGFIQANPSFRPTKSKAPIILIGAGTGIGPLAGFIRHNRERNPMHLYWGGRHPASDFLYQKELQGYLADNRLSRFEPAFSRHADRSYVQDRIKQDKLLMRQLIESNAQILVCGGRDMAIGVSSALEEILAPLQISVSELKEKGRLLEDVY
ncbi:MAG: PepSY-associated TM helix domain-containing protein [Reinekea sp.]|jgi:sulfite reductase (NADPH) flavoprotein alpha-component